jgi:RNA polymerase sigma-70 factor (ECF subfamily)
MRRDRRLEQLRARTEAVYRERLPELLRVAAAASGSRDAAPDLVQEAFARALRQLETYRGDGSFDGWLWRIVTNVARNHRRDRRPTAELGAGGIAPPAEAHDPDVAAAVAALPEQQRLALFLRYYADLDYRTIAEALAVAPGTVAATLAAARSTLLTRLGAKEATG